MNMFKNAVVLILGLSAASAFGAKNCEFTVEGNDQMKFNVSEITVDSTCAEVKVTLKHVGKLPKMALGHNWVLTKAADMAGVVTASATAGAAKDFLAVGDKRILAHTKLLGGGESDTATFKMGGFKKGEEYKFFCSFPGHSALMNGKFVVK